MNHIPIATFIISVICFISLYFFHYQKAYSNEPLVSKRRLDEDKINIADAKLKAQKLLNLIYNRFEMDGPYGAQFFRTTNNMAAHDWDIIKYKYAKKIVDIPNGDQQFLMIFGGSSVTAGHDNLYNQSYPMIVKKRMTPIFESLGLKFLVRNIAMGANNCLPYSFCYESMGGADPDVVGWEQSYNCGRSDDMFELVARWAGWSKNRGMVYFSASGGMSPSDCPPAVEEVPYCDEEWTPEQAGLIEWYPEQTELEEEKMELDKFYKAHPSADRFVGVINDYHGIGKHGFNVWEGNPHCEIPVMDNSGGGNNDDFTPVTRSNCKGVDIAGCGMLKFESYEASLYGSGGNGAKWHPPRAWHLLRGEAIVWLYTLTLLDALLDIEVAQGIGKTRSEMSEEYAKKLSELQPDMPHPKRCTEFCYTKPVCYTNFMPHYNPVLTLDSQLVGTTNWTMDDKDYGAWSLTYGYLDEKPGIHAVGGHAAGEIHFKITVGSENPEKQVWICGDAISGALDHAVFYLDQDVTAEDLIHYEPSNERVLWHKKKYMGNECKALLELPVGNHVISIITSEEFPDKEIGVTHIISWP